jgi:hypothetical protein
MFQKWINSFELDTSTTPSLLAVSPKGSIGNINTAMVIGIDSQLVASLENLIKDAEVHLAKEMKGHLQGFLNGVIEGTRQTKKAMDSSGND